MKNFEERLSRLEELSAAIQGGELSLEEAVSMFEEGIKLARGLEKELSRVERKVEILMNQPESPVDSPEPQLFPDIGEGEADE